MRLPGSVLCAALVAGLWPVAAVAAPTKHLLSSMSPGGSGNSKLFGDWVRANGPAARQVLDEYGNIYAKLAPEM